jgi:rhodanese-related sulfurtransferase
MQTQTLVKEICPTSTRKAIERGALLVDVREQDEVDTLSYDVNDLIHIPLSEFEDRFQEIPRDREIVMVCRSGARSLRAAAYLLHHGYENVVNMQFGIIRWVQKGFPTVGDTSSVLPKDSDCCSKPGCC